MLPAMCNRQGKKPLLHAADAWQCGSTCIARHPGRSSLLRCNNPSACLVNGQSSCTDRSLQVSWRHARVQREPGQKPTMGIVFDEPKYPVIDKAPGFWTTVGNFNTRDYSWFFGYSAASFPFGYMAGRSAGVALPSAWTALSIGALGGFLMAYSHSSGRLMGMFPNDGEVETASKR